jgi:hypothetical protein
MACATSDIYFSLECNPIFVEKNEKWDGESLLEEFHSGITGAAAVEGDGAGAPGGPGGDGDQAVGKPNVCS